MMNHLEEWVKHIILLILMATFLDLILPSSQMKKYVKLVVGFLILLLILSPVLHMFQYDPSQMISSIERILHTESRMSASEISQQQQSIERMQQEEIVQEVARNWKVEIEALLEKEFPVDVVDLQLYVGRTGDELFLQQMDISLQPVNDEVKNAATEEQSPVEVVQVKPVVIHIGRKQASGTANGTMQAPSSNLEEKKIEKEVLKLVQREWNISEDKIILTWIRR